MESGVERGESRGLMGGRRGGEGRMLRLRLSVN